MFTALMLLVGVLVLGSSQAVAADPAEANIEPLRDRFGDPLPPGVIRRFGTLRFRHTDIRNIAFTPDGKRLIAGGIRAPLVVFDAATGRKLRTLGNPISDDSSDFAVSPDSKYVACCGSDLSLWNLETGRPIRQLHCGRCKKAIFSPDGSRIAALWELQRGANDFQTGVTVMELATGNRLVEWTITKGESTASRIHELAYSPDGEFLAALFREVRKERDGRSQLDSSRVWLLDVSTKTRVRSFGSANVPVNSFAFQPHNKQLATLGTDNILRFWDVATGKEIRHLSILKRFNEDKFGTLRFSADGKRCVVLTDRRRVLTVLDVSDGRVLRRIEGDVGELWAWGCIALSVDGRTVVAARWDAPCARVWDVDSGVEQLADAGHRERLTNLSLSADGRTLTSRDWKGVLIHWDVRTARSKTRLRVPREEVGRFVLAKDFSTRTLRSPHWRMIYKYENPAMMEVWSPDGAKLIRKVTSPTRYFSGGVLSPDGTHLAIITSVGPNYTVLLWNPEREGKPRILLGPANIPGSLLFSHDGKRLISASKLFGPSSSGALWIWDVATARIVRKLAVPSVPGHLLLTANDRILFIGGNYDAAVHVWDMETIKEMVALPDPIRIQTSKEKDKPDTSKRAVTCLALSPDERFLAVVAECHDASIVTVWETASWKPIRSFAPMRPRNSVKTMLFSHDGRSLFAAYDDTTILEWDVSGHRTSGRHLPTGEKINKDRLNVLWQILAQSPDKAYAAVWEMLEHPAESVPFLIDHVSPVDPPQAKQIQRLIAQLDSDSFTQREEASRQLRALGKPFLPMLRQALKNRPSLEMRRRLQRILDSISRGLSSEELRRLRALAVLEWSATNAADKHLRRLADGVASASFTQAAKAARQRRNSCNRRK